MALTVIFGLTFSTLLTLVVIPLLYEVTENLRDRLLGTSTPASPQGQVAPETQA